QPAPFPSTTLFRSLRAAKTAAAPRGVVLPTGPQRCWSVRCRSSDFTCLLTCANSQISAAEDTTGPRADHSPFGSLGCSRREFGKRGTWGTHASVLVIVPILVARDVRLVRVTRGGIGLFFRRRCMAEHRIDRALGSLGA